MLLRSALTALLLLPALAGAQVPTIGVYRDEAATSCRITDTAGIVTVYVVIDGPVGVAGAHFSAPAPGCFHATWLFDDPVYPLAVGNSRTEVSLAFPGCLSMPAYVMAITYASDGTASACCDFPVLPPPGSTTVELLSCDSQLIPGEGLVHTINADETCFCGVDPPPDAPSDPFPKIYGISDTSIPTLTWSASDPLDDPLTFDLYLGVETDPPLYAAGVRDTFRTVFLEFGTHYYWRVVARDTFANETSSPMWQFWVAASSESRISVGEGGGYCGRPQGNSIAVPITLTRTAIPIADGGFEIIVDRTRLDFDGAVRGSLIGSWPSFDVEELGDTIRVTASGDAIPAGSDGVWATMFFNPTCCGVAHPESSQVCIGETYGDLRGQYPECGRFTCSVFSPDGDIHTDGVITAEDAQCALAAYVSWPNPPPDGCAGPGWDIRGDVDCSGVVTPADALCLLRKSLGGPCAFCGPGTAAAPTPSSVPATASRIVGVTSVERCGGFVCVGLDLSPGAPPEAFGFDMKLRGARYAGVDPAGTTLVFDELARGTIGPGHVRVGGYRAEEIANAGGAHITLRFVELDGGIAPTLELTRFVDDLAGSADIEVALDMSVPPAPSQATLEQNQPNPFNPSTRIAFALPDAQSDLRLRVYDVEGRYVASITEGAWPAGRHEVGWDGLDARGRRVASGVYFYVLSATGIHLQRKMVLLK